ncbi:Uncharacterised protein [Mycobacteroides abscessus subsp. abscessus]|nr:Uncharacterised protein [Mycobacteroides abscessus subsp. abscessus]
MKLSINAFFGNTTILPLSIIGRSDSFSFICLLISLTSSALTTNMGQKTTVTKFSSHSKRLDLAYSLSVEPPLAPGEPGTRSQSKTRKAIDRQCSACAAGGSLE